MKYKKLTWFQCFGSNFWRQVFICISVRHAWVICELAIITWRDTRNMGFWKKVFPITTTIWEITFNIPFLSAILVVGGVTWLRGRKVVSFCSIKWPTVWGVVGGLSVFKIKCPVVGGKYPFSVTECLGCVVVGGTYAGIFCFGGIYCFGCLSIVVRWSWWP